MREKSTIAGLGEILFRAPRSFAAMNDLYVEWAAQQHCKSKLARVSAAAVCICWSEDNDDRPPIYNLAAGDVIAYGAECIEWFFRKNASRSDVYVLGTELILDCVDLLPKEKEVEASAESFPKQPEAGPSGDAVGEGVGA